jgi:uncharacterized membrane protein
MSESKPPEPGTVPSPSPVAPAKEQPKTLEELIQEKAPDVLDAIPPAKRPKLAKVTIEQTQISYRSGLLPEPSELSAYGQIIPNGADRIMKMVEAQSAHRIQLESTVIGGQQKQEGRGQVFAFILALVFVLCGTYAALQGQPWYGGTIAGTSLVSLVGIFIYSKQQSQKDLSDKRQMVMTPAARPGDSDQHGSAP